MLGYDFMTFLWFVGILNDKTVESLFGFGEYFLFWWVFSRTVFFGLLNKWRFVILMILLSETVNNFPILLFPLLIHFFKHKNLNAKS